jgi:hypothetical protein
MTELASVSEKWEICSFYDFYLFVRDTPGLYICNILVNNTLEFSHFWTDFAREPLGS